MKLPAMVPSLIVLAVCVALASILPRACQPDPLPKIEARQEKIDSSHAVYAADSVASHTRIAMLTADSAAKAREIRRLMRSADDMRAQRQALSDSAPCDTALTLAVAETDTLRAVASRQFQAMRDAQLVAATAMTSQMRAEGQLSWERAQMGKQLDEALRAWRKARHAQCPTLLGLPLPQVGAGYGITYAGGRFVTGPEVSASIPLACLVR